MPYAYWLIKAFKTKEVSYATKSLIEKFSFIILSNVIVSMIPQNELDDARKNS